MSEIVISSPPLQVVRLAVEAQLLLHCEPHDAAAIADRCGLVLPEQMLTSAERNGWSSLHLAPDEWLLIGAGDDVQRLSADAHSAGVALSLVDISDRSLGVEVWGDASSDLLAGGCPFDVSTMIDGFCTRTMFGKVMVMLWRRGNKLRISYARSYDDYVIALVHAVATDLASERASV